MVDRRVNNINVLDESLEAQIPNIDKDVNYIAIEMYFKGRVFNTWMKRRRKKDRGYTASDPGFTHLIDGVDKLLRKQAAANCL